MNKDEIKKAFECCNNKSFRIACSDCPYHNEKLCIDTLNRDILTLVTEQENEIEQLKKENAYLLKACEEPFTFNTTQNKKYSVFNTVRKEFAEKLKEKLFSVFGKTLCSDFDTEDITIFIDELLMKYEKCGAEEKE